MARQTPVGARPNKRREAVLFEQDAAGRLLEGVGDYAPREMIIRSFSLRQNPAYRPGNSLLRLRWLVVLAAAAACRGRIPEQVISAPRPVVAAAEETPRAWALRPSALAREYRLEQRARVVSNGDGTESASDSTAVAVEASVRNVASGGVAGLVRTVVLSAPGSSAVVLPGLALPYAFSAAEPPTGMQIAPVGKPPATDPCTTPAQVPFGVLRDVLIRPPQSLVVGREWADSGTFVVCRDGVLLEVLSRRQFKLLGFERRDALGVLLVSRTGTLRVRGTSVRGTDSTRVEGLGDNSMRYELDATTGDVLTVSGTGSLDITVRGGTKTQRARQTSAIRGSVRVP